MNRKQMLARSAIESLRSGVPSRNAVTLLGTAQSDVRERFQGAMDAVAEGKPVEPIVISATFGGGKTHLLELLQSLAASSGFVTSYVVISPEMPLGNAQIVLKTLSDSARAPGHEGKAVRSLAAGLRTDSAPYRELQTWADGAAIDDRFRALLTLYDAFRTDEEFRVQILNDLEGRGLLKTIIKNRLNQIGEAAAYELSTTKSALLAHDRIRLLARFFRACGCKGWVVLFDEMERVAKFSLRQRMAAYTELGWWREAAQKGGDSFIPVFTTASGFVGESVVGGTHDERHLLGNGFELDEHDRRALSGMEALKRPLRLEAPTREDEAQIKLRVKAIYEDAYGALVPALLDDRPDVRISTRSEIRRWITRWDLRRFYPAYEASVGIEELPFDARQIADSELIDDSEDQ